MSKTIDDFKYTGTLVSYNRLLALIGERAFIEFIKHWSDHYDIYEIIKESRDGVHNKYLYGLVRHPRKLPVIGEIDVLSDGIYELGKLCREITSRGE